ncbi:MAG: EamA family transporter [Firmicutes bacterium]|nr:EamA family transporter [Bacillota bacterium]
MRTGILWVGLGAFLWGTAGLAGKVLTLRHGMDPLVIGAWRLAVSVPFLIAAAMWEAKQTASPPPGRRVRWHLLFGLAVAGYQASYFTAVDRTQVATATMLAVCTAPLLVAVFARAFLRERIGPHTGAALASGVLGTVLLIGVGSFQGLAQMQYLSGNLLALFAACCYAGYTLVGKHLLSGLPPFRVLAITFTLGAIFLSPFLQLPEPSLEAGLLLLYVGLVPTALAYLFYMYGLKRIPASRASVIALMEPLTAAILAVFLLGEGLTPVGWLGAALLLASFVLVSVGAERGAGAHQSRGFESGVDGE